MKDLNFIAIDFETANSEYSTICQIGMACFENGELIREESQLINPKTHFDAMNIAKHGITPQKVEGYPTFPEFYPEFLNRINNQIAIHHQPFDFSAYCQACEFHNLEYANTYWLDNAAVVRRTWEQFSKKGYGLKNVANYLGIEFSHHDACEDARTAGLIFIEACKLTGNTIEKWAELVEAKRIKPYHSEPSLQRIRGEVLKPNTYSTINHNYFYGKKVVISGTYDNWPDRNNLALILKNMGADIDSAVSDKTNILCAGNGVGPSKLKKMQTNIEAGKEASVLNEVEILELLVDFQFENNNQEG